MQQIVTTIIDFFYPPFKKFLPLHTFRYAACGGGNVLLDICLYFISYNFVLHKQVLHFGGMAFKPHVAAFLLSLCITLPVGFLLSKYVVWTGSAIKGRVQLFRYLLVVLVNILLNYIFIKLLVEYFNFFPTIAKIITTVMVIIFSYISQKHFTFKVSKG